MTHEIEDVGGGGDLNEKLFMAGVILEHLNDREFDPQRSPAILMVALDALVDGLLQLEPDPDLT